MRSTRATWAGRAGSTCFRTTRRSRRSGPGLTEGRRFPVTAGADIILRKPEDESDERQGVHEGDGNPRGVRRVAPPGLDRAPLVLPRVESGSRRPARPLPPRLLREQADGPVQPAPGARVLGRPSPRGGDDRHAPGRLRAGARLRSPAPGRGAVFLHDLGGVGGRPGRALRFVHPPGAVGPVALLPRERRPEGGGSVLDGGGRAARPRSPVTYDNIATLYCHTSGGGGVEAALLLVGVLPPPAARPLVLARPHRPGAGGAADRDVPLRVQAVGGHALRLQVIEHLGR